MRRLASLLFTFSCGFATVVACSSSPERPPAGLTSTEGGGGGGGEEKDSGDLDATSKADTLSCTDGQKGQQETDTDCGGPLCPGCDFNKACTADADCASGLTCSKAGKCASCNNQTLDSASGETDIDCGGTLCESCGIGKGCTVGSDCASGSCSPSKQCACPTGMTNVSIGIGLGTFCIDTTEVTKGDYQKFLASGYSTQKVAACKTANTTFQPSMAWPVQSAPLYNGTSTKDFQNGLPVHYVDWCDAYAYCDKYGKHLCGKLDGKSLAPSEANDATKSAWYNACSGQGTKAYPYGTTFSGSVCNSTGTGAVGKDPSIQKDVASAHYGYPGGINQDDGVYVVATEDENGNTSGYEHATCVTGSDALYQMSGNVAEWEDDCDGTEATSNCRVRGGSYAVGNDNPAALRCDAVRAIPRVPTDPSVLADIGFRCCLY